MKESLAGCQTRPADLPTENNTLLGVTPSSSVLKLYLNNTVREQWMKAYYDLEYKVKQLLHDKRGLSVVALYVASHGLLAILLFRLLVNL